MKAARLTIFAGHYGSGKTTLAIHYAIWLKQQGHPVALCDLDIVNPYFRTTDAEKLLAGAQIELISSRFANTNVDAPALPAQARSVFDRRDRYAVIDLGGDDRGALALGRYAELVRAEPEHEMLLVINPFRPLTREAAAFAAIRDEIEAASKVRVTGLVHNANLGKETSLSDVLRTLPFTQALAGELSLPLRMTAILQRLLPAPGSEEHRLLHAAGPVFSLENIGFTGRFAAVLS